MTSDDTKNAAKDIAGRVGQSTKDAGSSIKGAASKISDSAGDFIARAGETAGDLYDHARERAPEHASDALAAGQRAYSRGSRTVARQVSKQPVEALLLAGAIGYLVGWATSRS